MTPPAVRTGRPGRRSLTHHGDGAAARWADHPRRHGAEPLGRVVRGAVVRPGRGDARRAAPDGRRDSTSHRPSWTPGRRVLKRRDGVGQDQHGLIPEAWEAYEGAAARIRREQGYGWPVVLRAMDEADVMVIHGASLHGDLFVARAILFLTYLMKARFKKPIVIANHHVRSQRGASSHRGSRLPAVRRRRLPRPGLGREVGSCVRGTLRRRLGVLVRAHRQRRLGASRAATDLSRCLA